MKRTIDSKENAYYKDLVRLQKGDYERGLFLAEGEDLYQEARKNDALLEVLLPTDSTFETDFPDVTFLRPSLYRSLSSYRSLPPCMVLCRLRESRDLGEKVVYLDGIQDPGNLGTIFRTALAFSFTGVALSEDCVSIYNRKAIQSTKGALFSIPFRKVSLSQLCQEGYHAYLTTLDGQDMEEVPTLEKPFALAFGNEGHGIRKENLGLGKKLRIAMKNIDSLNVAIACSLFLYRYGKE